MVNYKQTLSEVGLIGAVCFGPVTFGVGFWTLIASVGSQSVLDAHADLGFDSAINKTATSGFILMLVGMLAIIASLWCLRSQADKEQPSGESSSVSTSNNK